MQLRSKEQNQSFWQLGSIQSVGLGLPGILFTQGLAKQFGAGTAILSVFVGNLVLWLVGMVVISMMDRNRMNAIENIKGYVGKYGGAIAALIFMFAFINWYALQILNSVTELVNLFQLEKEKSTELIIRLGAGLGLLSALLATGGIRLIKWVAIICLPFLFLYYLVCMGTSAPSIFLNQEWHFSFYGIISWVLIQLPGMVNLPTFFRHSRSRADSYLALTYMTILISFFQIASIGIQFTGISQSLLFQVVVLSAFIMVLLVCNNLLNIYFASACWEAIIPRFGGAKGFAIIGLLGTAAYTFMQISSTMVFLMNLANGYIINLGIVLLIAFLVRIVVRHRPRILERWVNGISWLVGCIASTTLEVQNSSQGIQSLLVGGGVSALFFLTVIFIEETLWAMSKIGEKRLS